MAESISVTICGDGGCGKSSLTSRIVHGVWTHDYDPTIEDRYSVTRRVDGTPCILHLTDTAGQEEYRDVLFPSSSSSATAHHAASSGWRNDAESHTGDVRGEDGDKEEVDESGSLLQTSDAFLLVYSITSRASLDMLSLWEELVERECARRRRRQLEWQRQQQQRNGGADGKDYDRRLCWPGVMVVGNKCDLASQREVSSRDGLSWARARGYGFMETSARESVNVEETFSALIRRVFEARRLHASGQHQPSPSGTGLPRSLDLSGATAANRTIRASDDHQPLSAGAMSAEDGVLAEKRYASGGGGHSNENAARSPGQPQHSFNDKRPSRRKSIIERLNCF